MLENTTRSATIVFRFCNFNFGEVSLKASYAIRVRCPNRPPHTAAETTTVRFGFIEHGLVPFGSSSPLAGPVIAYRPCKVLPFRFGTECRTLCAKTGRAGDGCHWAHPPMSKINLRHRSPPRTQTGKEKSISDGFPPPSNGWNDSKSAVLRQWRTRPNWHTVSDTQCQNTNSAPQTRHGIGPLQKCL